SATRPHNFTCRHDFVLAKMIHQRPLSHCARLHRSPAPFTFGGFFMSSSAWVCLDFEDWASSRSVTRRSTVREQERYLHASRPGRTIVGVNDVPKSLD